MALNIGNPIAGKNEVLIDAVTTDVSNEVQTAAVNAILSEGEVEIVKVLFDNKSETLAVIQRLLASAGINGVFSLSEDEQGGPIMDIEAVDEVVKHTLEVLEKRFVYEGYLLHLGCEWRRVKLALLANPKAILSIRKMEVQGHEPDVYNFDEEGFDIGTCSKEAPESARGCVYDAESAAWRRKEFPQRSFNGSAVEMAEAMGIGLMPPKHYYDFLQRKTGAAFDKLTSNWVLTPGDFRKSSKRPSSRNHAPSEVGQAYLVSGSYVLFDQWESMELKGVDAADFHCWGIKYSEGARDSLYGWRGSLRVPWASVLGKPF